MDFQRFDEMLDQMIAEEKEVGKTKAQEYVLNEDRLDNFKHIGKEIGLTPKQVWYVYFKKHVDAITSYIKSGSVKSEPIYDRIKDARVYLSLLRGLIEEEEERDCEFAQTFVTFNALDAKSFERRVKGEIVGEKRNDEDI